MPLRPEGLDIIQVRHILLKAKLHKESIYSVSHNFIYPLLFAGNHLCQQLIVRVGLNFLHHLRNGFLTKSLVKIPALSEAVFKKLFLTPKISI